MLVASQPQQLSFLVLTRQFKWLLLLSIIDLLIVQKEEEGHKAQAPSNTRWGQRFQ